jgi:hypothetical protein
MAFSSSHWTIDYDAKTVTNNDSGTGSNVPAVTGNQDYVGTALEFFQWLATEFASTSQMDDEYPIESQTPTVYKWLNDWGFGHADDTNYLSGGSFESSDGLELWSNLYSIGSQVAGTQLYLIQNDAEVTPWWDTDNIDILVKVKNAGTFIQSVDTSGTLTDGGVWVYAREYGDEYDHNFANLSGGGRNPIGINTADDGNNTTAEGTVAGWSDVTITFGTISRDLNNGNGSVNYDVEINCGGRPMTEVYERLKYVTRYGETTIQLNSDDGQEYRSADEGTYLEVKKAPFGTLAGTTLYGARGVWFTNYSAADFVLIDAAGATQSPPNYQKVKAEHASLSGCNVFVAEISGGNIVKDQYTISSVSSNTITATAAINANKAPQSGVIRVGDTKYAYTGFSGDTFAGVTPDPTGETGDFYVPLLDVTADATSEQSDNIIYTADFDIRTSVRKYGFKPYDVDTTFSSAGRTFAPILTNDPQAS